MNANTRIQWVHKKILNNSYPNAQRLAERFRISHRQAQRDLDLLRKRLGAPLEYDKSRKGFYYSEPFTLPILITSDNDELYIQEISSVRDDEELGADASIIQMQIPYSATVELSNKLAAIELSNYIIAKQGKDRYYCEFHSIEKFIGILMSLESDFRLVEPDWLRERLVRCAVRVLANHPTSDDTP
ncbi:MAG: hypothetical protein E7629_08825 [Ruminococcaceae bacterium]|nr:hypothetical protein [Oscillospiraceae bacterium]